MKIQIGTKIELSIENITVTVTAVYENGTVRYEGSNGERGILTVAKLKKYQIHNVIIPANEIKAIDAIQSNFPTNKIIVASKETQKFIDRNCVKIAHTFDGQSRFVTDATKTTRNGETYNLTLLVNVFENGNARVTLGHDVI